MNIYFIGMMISLAVYVLIGLAVSRKIRSVDDYYVAGRRAPMLLIAGSLVASYTSTGTFMGDAGQAYDGAMSSLILLATMQTAGYILGAVFFGRYLRRARVLTIPEFFGKRFVSKKMKGLAAVTAITMMTVYLLSVMQGVGTLMSTVTGVGYNWCIFITLIVLTFITVIAGSRGVLITDTLMAAVFTVALLLAVVFIGSRQGGWWQAVAQTARDPETAEMLSWAGKPGALFATGAENLLWGLVYGIVWMSVCMVGPWQSSRYLMAKDEHTVVRSAVPAALGVFLLETLVCMSAVFVHLYKPELDSSPQVLIWAAMNAMPKLLGVILLTGVLAAGISSATTFLSLIGASFANDVLGSRSSSDHIRTGQIAMLLISAVVLLIAVLNPPSIFWVTYLGGAIVASAWMPVVVACIAWKRLTRTGAFCGMLAGFLSCFLLRLYTGLTGTVLPVWLDPSIVGMGCNVAAMVIGSALTRVTPEEMQVRASLFVMPASERDPKEVRRTMSWAKGMVGVGVLVTVLLLLLWVIPYLRAVRV